jgi:hypothetical protein
MPRIPPLHPLAILQHGDDMALAICPEVYYGTYSALPWWPFDARDIPAIPISVAR